MVYALILGNKNENIVALIILYEVTVYTDVFFKENTGKFSEHGGDDYIINLNEQDSLFEFLYNLLSSELKIFQEYLDDALMKR